MLIVYMRVQFSRQACMVLCLRLSPVCSYDLLARIWSFVTQISSAEFRRNRFKFVEMTAKTKMGHKSILFATGYVCNWRNAAETGKAVLRASVLAGANILRRITWFACKLRASVSRISSNIAGRWRKCDEACKQRAACCDGSDVSAISRQILTML